MRISHCDRSATTARACLPTGACVLRRAMAALAVVALLAGCGSGRSNPAFEPHENLLSILADLERYTGHDLYRYRAPLDPAGTNLYRASLVRLRNYERLHPDRYPDVVAFARGRALERLDDHEQAAEAFGAVMEMDTPIAAEAAEAMAINRLFARVQAMSHQAETMHDYIETLARQRDAFQSLAEPYTTTDSVRGVYGALAMRQVERLDVLRAEAMWKYRHLFDSGTEQALRAWHDVLDTHQESARIEQHRLRVADCFYEQAREYGQEFDPETAAFDWEVFRKITSEAMALYRQVERAYGYPERLEAEGKIAALNATINRVREMSQ